MTVKREEYNNSKEAFFKKHNNDFKCSTSPLCENGKYHKEYVFEDGAVWYEVIGVEYVKTSVEVKFVQVEVEVRLYKTEFWNTDDSKSKYYYEKF